MNEILQILGHHFASGRFILTVKPDDPVDPHGIVVHFSDGTKQSHPLSIKDRADFVRLWRQGFAYWNFKWEPLDSPNATKKEPSVN